MSEATDIIQALRAQADPEKAAKMRAYHKTSREVLGVANPEIDALVRAFRDRPETDLEMADALWQSGIYEARIMAAKLLTRGRLRQDVDLQYWAAVMGYAPDFDGWAIADAMAGAAHKRVLNPDERFMDLQSWRHSAHLWTKRAALVYTLPFARLKTPNAAQKSAVEEILNWAADYVLDEEWFIQKSVSWWVRELSKRRPERAREFLSEYGAKMQNFARKDAAKYL